MANSIIYPEQTTYFICYNKNRESIMAYGVVEPISQMETGQPILDTYLEKTEWQKILKENGIDTENEK
jgi:hypothetical protein